MSAYTWNAEDVAGRFNGRRSGSGWIGHCPSHDDRTASLTINEKNGKTFVRCQAGCDQASVWAAVVKAMNGSPNGNGHVATPSERRPFGEPIVSYEYVDEKGSVLYQVQRDAEKNFRHRRPAAHADPGEPQWIANMDGVRRVLYRLPEVMAAVAMQKAGRFPEPIFAVEGEKDADALANLGLVATTNSGGAGKWLPEHTESLRGASVVILPDNDAPGRRHAEHVARALRPAVREVRVLELAGIPEKGDVSDWLAAGGTKAALLQLASEVRERPADPPKPAKVGSVKRDAQQGQEIKLPEVEPWLEPVDGAALLVAIVAVLKRYVAMPATAADACALWAVHAHAVEAADYSPILTISSPIKGCGKTTLQQRVMRRLVPRAVPSVNISGPALFRLIEATGATVLLDEFDSLGPEARETLRNLLNAGVGRDDAFVWRVIGDQHKLRRFAVFGPKSIALNGRLAETLEDRSIVIRLERKKKEEAIERLRRARADEVLTPLQRMAARWARDNMAALRERDPEIPSDLNDRACDLWEPLLAIADTAGGQWPERARRAARALSSGRDEERGVKEQLLSDIAAVFKDRKMDRIPSTDLIAGLIEMEGRPWAEWYKGRQLTSNGLAKLLKAFGIGPKSLRDGDKVLRGYDVAAFEDAFRRYVPCSSSSGGSVAANVALENGQFSAPGLDCSGVALETPPTPKTGPEDSGNGPGLNGQGGDQ